MMTTTYKPNPDRLRAKIVQMMEEAKLSGQLDSIQHWMEDLKYAAIKYSDRPLQQYCAMLDEAWKEVHAPGS